MMPASTIVTPDPSGDIHQSRLDQADAPILALGAELREHVAATDAIWTRAIALQDIGTPEARTEADALIRVGNERSGEYQRLLSEIRDTPAHTQAGMAEKAFAVLQWLSPGGEEIPDDHEDGRVAWSLARDVLRMAGVSRHDGANPDAELIAACGRFDENELRLLRLCYGPTKVPDAEWEAASDAVVGMTSNGNPALPDILRHRATTMEGARALARSAVIEADNAFRRQIEGGEDAMCPTPLAVLAVSLAGFDAPGPEIEGGRL